MRIITLSGTKDNWTWVQANALPNYTGSWDAIMREVRKLNEEQFERFVMFLGEIQPFLHPLQNSTTDTTRALILTLHP